MIKWPLVRYISRGYWIRRGDRVIAIQGSYELPVADVCKVGKKEYEVANGLVMAAAPRMLELLEDIHPILVHCLVHREVPPSNDLRNACKKMEDIICDVFEIQKSPTNS